MTPNKYVELASRTDPDRTKQVMEKIGAWTPSGAWLVHAHIGLSGEVGELAAALQRWLYYGKELDKVNVIEEVGDLLWYTAQLCRALGVSMEDVMERNIAKLKKRYAEKYTDQEAAEENRDRAAERKILANPEFQAAFEAGVRKAESEAEQLPSGQGHYVRPDGSVPPTSPMPTQSGNLRFRIEKCYEQTGSGFAEPPEDVAELQKQVPGKYDYVDSDLNLHSPGRLVMPSVEQQVRQLDDPNPYTARELKREAPVMVPNRAQLTDGYPTLCRLCKAVAVHKNNSMRVCPDCMAESRREFCSENNQNAPAT